jgi:hypothetical protein
MGHFSPFIMSRGAGLARPLPIDFTAASACPAHPPGGAAVSAMPSRLLKTELIAFRDSLRPARFDEKGELVEPGNRNAADVQLLDRWIQRCDREDLDETLWKPFRDAMPAPELIRLELQARRKVQAAVNQIYGAKWEAPSSDEIRRIREKLEAEGRTGLVQISGGGEIAGLSKEWRELKDKLTNNLSLANLDILERAYDMHATYAHLMGDFDAEPSQRDAGGTRRNRLFWDFVGGYLYLRLGGWFDNEVAILTEIAFGLDDGSTDPRHINHARRQR